MKREDAIWPTASDLDFLDVMGPEPELSNCDSSDNLTEEVGSATAIPSSGDDPTKPDAPEESRVIPDEGVSLSAPVAAADEILVPLNRLKEWVHHPATGSRTRGDNAAGTIASALDPANIPTITLLPSENDLYPIQNGRWRWRALREVHGKDNDIEVRCVMFPGTEAEAVQAACDDALGGAPRSAIETARAILNVQRIARISQKAIPERYSVLKKDQVSRMTIAAKTVESFPMVFNLLEESDRVSIDLCVKFNKFMKTASDEERSAVLEEAEIHASAGASLKRNELFEALGIEQDGRAGGPTRPDPLAPIESMEVFGADDQPVGAMEMLADEVMRIRLPDPATMAMDQREAAAAAFIDQIRAYFGLDTAV